jgi:hypothetical protein
MTTNPQEGTGCVVALLGCLLAPLLLGLPLIVWGFVMRARAENHWACSGCGQTFPNVLDENGVGIVPRKP